MDAGFNLPFPFGFKERQVHERGQAEEGWQTGRTDRGNQEPANYRRREFGRGKFLILVYLE